MCILDQTGNFGKADTCTGPSTEFRRADINGICAVIDGGHADFSVAGRSQQFQCCDHSFTPESKSFFLDDPVHEIRNDCFGFIHRRIRHGSHHRAAGNHGG